MALILVVEDKLLIGGMCVVLEAKGFTPLKAGNYQDALSLYEKHQPSLAVIDIEIPQAKGHIITDEERTLNLGLRLARDLKDRNPTIGIVLFSDFKDRKHLFETYFPHKAGQAGIAYILKGEDFTNLLDALYQVQHGRSVVDPEVGEKPLVPPEVSRLLTEETQLLVKYGVHVFAEMSPRQKEVAQLLAQGWTYKSVAQQLGIKVEGVESQARDIYRALGLDNLRFQENPQSSQVILSLIVTSLAYRGELEGYSR